MLVVTVLDSLGVILSSLKSPYGMDKLFTVILDICRALDIFSDMGREYRHYQLFLENCRPAQLIKLLKFIRNTTENDIMAKSRVHDIESES